VRFPGQYLNSAFDSLARSSLLGSLITGRLLNRDFQIVLRQQRQEQTSQEDSTRKKDVNDLSGFPIERARLRSLWVYVLVFSAALVGYGWSLEQKAHLAVPLIMQFISERCGVSHFECSC
jgi:Mg/Co/Ni transporter MgtE